MLAKSLIIVSAATVVLASKAQSALAQNALEDILARGAPILGYNEGCNSRDVTCDWMSSIENSVMLVEMSIPGTHDSATWNYTQATQDSLIRYTGTVPAAEFYQCQEHSIFQMLNGGIRVFDLRVAYNPGNDTIGFYHAAALLSPTTRIEDVFFGLYSWLDQHPTEAVLISINHEAGTGTTYNLAFEQLLYDILQSDLAKQYWVQANGTLGTLGEARGKLTLLQRFDWSLPNNFGIYLSASEWTDNSPSIEIVYNDELNQTAYIEDYYEIGTTGATNNIQWKFNATTAHIESAIAENLDQLYISFASSEHTADVPPETPRIMAVGNGTDVPGVNQKLLPWLQDREGKRFGIIMLDFFDTVQGLVEAIIAGN